MDAKAVPLKTRGFFHSDGEGRETGWSAMELRGNLLILSYAKTHRITTEFFTIDGASRINKKRLASRRFILMLLCALLSLLFAVLAHLLSLAGLVMLLIGLMGILLIGAPIALLVRIPTTELLLPASTGLVRRILNHSPEKDAVLDSILERIPCIDHAKQHVRRVGPVVVLKTDWLGAYPVRFAAFWTLVLYGLIYGNFESVLKVLEWFGIEELPTWFPWLLLLPFLVILAITVASLVRGRGAWSHRAVRRAAIRAMGRGDFIAGEAALLKVLVRILGDFNARALLAHACAGGWPV